MTQVEKYVLVAEDIAKHEGSKTDCLVAASDRGYINISYGKRGLRAGVRIITKSEWESEGVQSN